MISFFDKIWNSSEESRLHTQLRRIKRCSSNQVGFFPSRPANRKGEKQQDFRVLKTKTKETKIKDSWVFLIKLELADAWITKCGFHLVLKKLSQLLSQQSSEGQVGTGKGTEKQSSKRQLGEWQLEDRVGQGPHCLGEGL